METLDNLFEEFKNSVNNDKFVKITLSKPIRKSENLNNVYVREITIKETTMFQFLYRYASNDQVKNYILEDAIEVLEELFTEKFRAGSLFTLEKDVLVFISKKGKISYRTSNPSFKNKLPATHDHVKTKKVVSGKYLQYLGITDNNDKVIPKMADKYRQINKYLEIIEGLLVSVDTTKPLHIVDMGSGKGYLTFALYDYLKNHQNYDVSITGIELREELVEYCNTIASKCKFDNLNFIAQRIEKYTATKIDILIALHACDTATDDAIYKGLHSKSDLIICAPCCHKQIRQQVKGKEQESPILKHGIFKERQFEMVTDTIRALILEKHNYNTKVFEFISNEHTRKNVMLVGSKSSKLKEQNTINDKIKKLKADFQIEQHYLEKLIDHKE